jgi:hypothetical protein
VPLAERLVKMMRLGAGPWPKFDQNRVKRLVNQPQEGLTMSYEQVKGMVMMASTVVLSLTLALSAFSLKIWLT